MYHPERKSENIFFDDNFNDISECRKILNISALNMVARGGIEPPTTCLEEEEFTVEKSKSVVNSKIGIVSKRHKNGNPRNTSEPLETRCFRDSRYFWDMIGFVYQWEAPKSRRPSQTVQDFEKEYPFARSCRRYHPSATFRVTICVE